MKTLSVILPCYNEEASLPLYFKAVDPVLKELKNCKVGFILVNDGSKDKTLDVMEKLHEERDDVTIVSLSRNFGQIPAFSAGLSIADSDYVVLMDADLQDPVELLPKIVEKFEEGYDVVNPHRADRSKDSFFKRKTAGMFYRFINKIEGRPVLPQNVNCFRGLSRRAYTTINALPEKDRYLLGEIPFVGFKNATIDFKREERSAGKSKYTFKKMVDYALNNISSSTTAPLYYPMIAGGISSAFFAFTSIVLTVFYFLSLYGIVPGHDPFKVFLLISVIFLASSILVCFVGILGIYLHNVTVNTRARPTYVIDFVKKEGDKD